MNKIFKLFFIFVLLFSFNNIFAQELTIKELVPKLEGHSLLVYKNGTISFQDEHGIKPLLIQINKKGLEGAVVVDKIIGKAAALLMVYGGVSEVYTTIIAKDAIKVFNQYNVKYSASEVVEFIYNKNKDGLCPMEQAVKNIDDPESAYKCFNK